MLVCRRQRNTLVNLVFLVLVKFKPGFEFSPETASAQTVLTCQPVQRVPNSFSSSVVRIFSQDDAANYVVTVKENPRELACTINATANDSTLITLSAGDTTLLNVGDRLMHSTDTSVVNTDVASEIASIVNSSAVAANVDIVVATGDASIYAVEAIKTITIQPGKELFLEKDPEDWVESNEGANIVATAVAYSS